MLAIAHRLSTIKTPIASWFWRQVPCSSSILRELAGDSAVAVVRMLQESEQGET